MSYRTRHLPHFVAGDFVRQNTFVLIGAVDQKAAHIKGGDSSAMASSPLFGGTMMVRGRSAFVDPFVFFPIVRVIPTVHTINSQNKTINCILISK